MSSAKFWVVYSTDMDKHPPEAVMDSEYQAENVANNRAAQSPGIHFYVLEAKSEYVGTVKVESHDLEADDD